MSEIYRGLAALYGWPAEVVAAMTRDQQMIYLTDSTDPRTGRETITFRTAAEALKFMGGGK